MRLRLRTNICLKLLTILLCVFLSSCDRANQTPIKVGILHSSTGTMAISEQSVIDATQMAIDEINASGGGLGRSLSSVVIDGKSDGTAFAIGAEQLITKDKVSVIFGCWTSASRKKVKPIIEAYNHLLFYPVQYEGLEQSPNIIYTGATPNQQITPAVKWSTERFGKRISLAASDYVFPRAANTLIKKQLIALNANVVGEYYLPLGDQDVDAMIKAIAKTKPNSTVTTYF